MKKLLGIMLLASTFTAIPVHANRTFDRDMNGDPCPRCSFDDRNPNCRPCYFPW